LVCWGYNVYGQLGYGHTNSLGDDEAVSNLSPVAVGGTVVELAVGMHYTCALLDTGNVRCWGYAAYGQLGYGNTNNIGDNEAPSAAGDVNVGGTVQKLVAGYYHTCALLQGGAMRCWGYNRDGQLGYGHTSNIGDDETPASAGDINTGATVTQIAAIDYHTCAVLSTSESKCWGYNSYGQLGYGDTSDRATPGPALSLGGDIPFLMAGGYRYTCALLSSGNARCWGYGAHGQLGYASTSTSYIPPASDIRIIQ
jgi:alpha-tubulin suppressor-like RCC1 family protein